MVICIITLYYILKTLVLLKYSLLCKDNKKELHGKNNMKIGMKIKADCTNSFD